MADTASAAWPAQIWSERCMWAELAQEALTAPHALKDKRWQLAFC